MLSKGAFNALLKTLEEPPGYALFILATTELHKVPETIVSRCERYDFTTIPAEQIIDRLKKIAKAEKVKADVAVLEEIARRSEGCARDAETLLGQVLALGEKNVTLDIAQTVLPMVDMTHVLSLLAAMVKGDATLGLNTVQGMMDRGVDVKTVLEELLALLRSVLLSQVGERPLTGTYTKEQGEEIEALTSGVAANRVRVLLDIVLKAMEERRDFTLPQLALELMVVDACQSGRSTTSPHGGERVRESPSDIDLADGPGARVVSKPAMMDVPMTASVTINPAVTASSLSEEMIAPLTLADVKKHWPSFQKTLRVRHASLPLALEGSEPIRMEGTTVMVKVAFEFYAETVNHPKNSQFLAQLLSELLGRRVGVQALFQNVSMEPNVLRVLEAFGGEVVG